MPSSPFFRRQQRALVTAAISASAILCASVPGVAWSDSSPLPSTAVQLAVEDALQAHLRDFNEISPLKDSIAALNAPVTGEQAEQLRAALEPAALQQMILRGLDVTHVEPGEGADAAEVQLASGLTSVFASAGYQAVREAVREAVASPSFVTAVEREQAGLDMRTPRSVADFLMLASASGPEDFFPGLVGVAAALISGIAVGICYGVPACAPFAPALAVVTGTLAATAVLAASTVNQLVTKCGTTVNLSFSGSDVIHGAGWACQAFASYAELGDFLDRNGETYDGYIQPFYNTTGGRASQQVYGSFPACFTSYSYITGRSNGRDFAAGPAISSTKCRG